MKYRILIATVCLIFCVSSALSLYANELVRGKVVAVAQSYLVIRLPSGQKEKISLNNNTKIMHRAGSGAQATPAKLITNAKVAASLDGRTAVFVVVEEVPK